MFQNLKLRHLVQEVKSVDLAACSKYLILPVSIRINTAGYVLEVLHYYKD